MKSKLPYIIVGLLVLGTLLLQWFGPEHPYPAAWDEVPLFYAAFGLVGALLLIGLAKGILAPVVQKPENYYERDS